jgi:hypothetical protein
MLSEKRKRLLLAILLAAARHVGGFPPACESFWTRPLAERSTCFTETLECREVRKRRDARELACLPCLDALSRPRPNRDRRTAA